MTQPSAVLHFWFVELKPLQWYAKSASLDQTIKLRFGEAHEAASRGELEAWRDGVDGRLAEILLLDQFSRNIHRDQARAFAQDAQALTLAQEAVRGHFDLALTPIRRAFVYLPYMHAESRVVQKRSVELFSGPGLGDNLRFAVAHEAVIARFGRFPHRNVALGRRSTAEEIEYMQSHPNF